MSQQIINKEEVLRIQPIEGLLPYDVKSKMAGQTYQRFSFGGKVFITNKPGFLENLELGEIAEVELDTNDEGLLSMLSFVTWKQKNNIKRRMVENEAITVDNFKPTFQVTTELLNSIS